MMSECVGKTLVTMREDTRATTSHVTMMIVVASRGIKDGVMVATIVITAIVSAVTDAIMMAGIGIAMIIAIVPAHGRPLST